VVEMMSKTVVCWNIGGRKHKATACGRVVFLSPMRPYCESRAVRAHPSNRGAAVATAYAKA